MSGKLAGKVALVVGASVGIGRATAKKLAREGATVIAASRREAVLKDLCGEIAAEGGKAEPMVLDAGDLKGYVAALGAVAKKHGTLDVLVHNAMSGRFRPLAQATIEEYREDSLVNSEAVFLATQEAVRIMKDQPAKGSIVHISTIAAMRSVPGLGTYGATKAAMIRLAQSYAVEAAPFGIRVNCVVPGVIDTESMRGSFGNDPGIAKMAAEAIPMKRFGTPDELANVVSFLASDEASYVTGLAVLVDGGKFAA